MNSYLPDSIKRNEKKISDAEKAAILKFQNVMARLFNSEDGVYVLECLKEYCGVDYTVNSFDQGTLAVKEGRTQVWRLIERNLPSEVVAKLHKKEEVNV